MGSQRARQTNSTYNAQKARNVLPSRTGLSDCLRSPAPMCVARRQHMEQLPQVNQNPACQLHTSKPWPDLVRPPSWASDVLSKVSVHNHKVRQGSRFCPIHHRDTIGGGPACPGLRASPRLAPTLAFSRSCSLWACSSHLQATPSPASFCFAR